MTEVDKIDTDIPFINELTMTGDGTVTYSSDNATVATVDSKTGEVTITGIGEAKITATVATWYDLKGRKLQGKPAQKGVYLRNGKTVVIK